MILKIGIYGKEEIEAWKYFENISNLMITSFISNEYYFEKETKKIMYKPNGGVITQNDKGEDETYEDAVIDLTDCADRMFNPEWCDSEVGILYVSLVEFTDEKNDQFRLACAGGSVYLMNNDGKTIDKY